MTKEKKSLIDAINQSITEGHGWHVPPELQKGGIFGNVLLPKKSEVDILKAKLAIAEKALANIGSGLYADELIADYAREALEKMSKLDGQ